MSHQGCQECPNCHRIYEKVEGCDHINCPNCQVDFCYKCGQNISSGTHTCPGPRSIPVVESQSDGNFIFVKTITGQTITIPYDPTARVDTARQAIIDKIGNSDGLRLIYAGKQLESGNRLSDYGIQKNCTMFAVLRVKGGMQYNK